MWKIEYTNEFEEWWEMLQNSEQEDIDSCIGLLIKKGPNLRFPYSSRATSSRHEQMRELRIQHKEELYRILYAVNPKRAAILLLCGDKSGDDSWYIRCVPIADSLYDEYLLKLMKEEYQ